MRFHNREQAGRALAERLREDLGTLRETGIILALPRGGVPVAVEVAKALGWPWDIFLVRKIGSPAHAELAMGAVAQGGVVQRNEEVIRFYSVDDETFEAVKEAECRELERRQKFYRGERPPPGLHGATVIVVDDGLATGATMAA